VLTAVVHVFRETFAPVLLTKLIYVLRKAGRLRLFSIGFGCHFVEHTCPYVPRPLSSSEYLRMRMAVYRCLHLLLCVLNELTFVSMLAFRPLIVLAIISEKTAID